MEIYTENRGFIDPFLGDPVTVNNRSLYEFDADLIDYELVQAVVNYDLIKKVGKHSYIINKYSNGNNGIKLRFYIGGVTKQQAQINCNNVVREFQKDIVIVRINDTEFEYAGVLSSIKLTDTTVKHYYLLEITLVAVKRLPVIIKEYTEADVTEGITFEYDGVIDCGVMIGVKTNAVGTSFSITVNDDTVEITNSDDWSYHVIDGLDGRVIAGASSSGIFEGDDDFVNYQNNFQNTDLYKFPILTPGINNISVSCESGEIDRFLIKYYPIFIV